MSQKTISDPDAVLVGLKHTTKTRTRYNKNSRQYVQDITLDFTGCTVRDLLEWASAERVIKFQKKLRQMESVEKFDSFMQIGNQLDLFAAEAHLRPEQHSDRADIINKLITND